MISQRYLAAERSTGRHVGCMFDRRTQNRNQSRIGGETRLGQHLVIAGQTLRAVTVTGPPTRRRTLGVIKKCRVPLTRRELRPERL